MLTAAQQLANQFDEDTGGLWRDPDTQELIEWDEYYERYFDHELVFARAASLTGRGSGIRANGAPLSTGNSSAAPNLTQHIMSQKTPAPGCAGCEATGSTSPLEAGGLALPFEHSMWTD